VAVDPSGAVEVAMLLAGLDEQRRLAMYAEAAEVCECPVGTIRSRVSRARADVVEGLRDADAR